MPRLLGWGYDPPRIEGRTGAPRKGGFFFGQIFTPPMGNTQTPPLGRQVGGVVFPYPP
jgi:hypothetical protein